MSEQPAPPAIVTRPQRRTRVDMLLDQLKQLNESELVEAVARIREYLKSYADDRRRHWAGWLKKIRL